MPLSSVKEYVNQFFDHLEVWEDINRGQAHKQSMHKRTMRFLNDCSIENAFAVYEAFFEAYWIGTQNSGNPFIELVQRLRLFEENVGQLVPGQRDHCVHSVYVFILGLAIHARNRALRLAFRGTVLDNPVYRDLYRTKHEEFLYRWGIASLFHDIAYPIEITEKQMKTYLTFLSNQSNMNPNDLMLWIGIDSLMEFGCLPPIEPSSEFSEEFGRKYPSFGDVSLADAAELLAYKLSTSFGINAHEVRANLIGFPGVMQANGFIDHGYYSALIVLRWYHNLVRESRWNPAYFYFPIVDSASAILLHNYYRHVLMKPPFELGRLRAIEHPIAFLLILCDEIQNWSRALHEEPKSAADGFDIVVSDNVLEVEYNTDAGCGGGECVIARTEEKIRAVLDVDELFSESFALRLMGG